MSHETKGETRITIERIVTMLKHKKRTLFIVCGLVVALLVIFFISNRNGITRHPSMAAFCRAYHVSRGADDLSDKVSYLRNLEQYAPNDIYPTIHKMRTTYEQAQKQPSDYFGLEMGITGSINNFNDYTSTHCTQ